MTGDDVANSLYYIHLDTPGDELLAPKQQRHEGASRTSMDSTRSHDTHRIARKPLPASSHVSQPQTQTHTPIDATNPEDTAKFPPLGPPPAYNKENIPIAGETSGPSNPFASTANMPAPPVPAKVAQTPAPIPRKALGPRQMPAAPPSPSRDMPAPPPEALHPATPPTPEEGRPLLPPRPVLPPLHLDNVRGTQSFDEMRSPGIHPRNGSHTPQLQSPLSTNPSRSPSPWSRQQQKPFTPFSLTIIRRDPGTGHQWNIGKVSSFQSTILFDDPHNPDAEPVVQYPKGYPAINVHIETSGYARFRDFPTALPKLEAPQAGGATLAQNMKQLAAAMKTQSDAATREQQQQHDDGEGGFRRQVVMGYGKSWTHNLREAIKGRSGGTRSRSSTTTSAGALSAGGEHPEGMVALDPPRAVGGFHRRQDSGNSTNSNDSSFFPDPSAAAAAAAAGSPVAPGHQQPHAHAHPHAHPTTLNNHAHAHPETPTAAAGDDQPVLTVPGPGLRPKGYTFLSPWDGRCDFRTSSNGRGLKCRHTRNTTSQGFNPLAAAQALRDAASSATDGGRAGGGGGRSRGASASVMGGGGGGGDMGKTVPVSELRFNLPSTDLFHSKEDRERAAREVVEGFGRMLVRSPGGHERDGDEDGGEDDEEPVFDFSGLGRERAGGGNRGKRAKLGKLLIHDEGLKMLDLVVAANMGIWWQAWERSF